MTLVECFVAYALLCISAVTALPYSDDGLRNKELAGHRVLAVYGKQEDGRSPRCKVIFEDRTGVYWAGTFGGLKRYDEKSDRWNDEIRVPWNVDFILQSADGKLWFGCRYLRDKDAPTLVSFDGKEWRNIESLPTTKRRVRPGAPTVLFPGCKDELWFARGNGLLAYDAQDWSGAIEVSEAIGSEFPVSIRAGLYDSRGDIWLATSEGIVRFDGQSQEWRIVNPDGYKGVLSEPALNIYSRLQIVDGIYGIYEDRKGRIWFASAGWSGFHLVYDRGDNSWRCYKLVDELSRILGRTATTGLTSMYQDRPGRMMFGTNLGLLTFTETENKWELFTRENSGLPDSLITTIFEDRSGRIWIGTGKGIVVLER